MKHTIPIIALATEVLMVLTKRKLRPDGFQTVEPPGSLAMPTYSCFSNSCTLTDCEMYKWDVHGLRQNNIPKLELLRDIKTLTHVNSNWPLSSIYIFFFFLFVTIKPSSFLFPHCRERKTKQNKTVSSWDVYSGGKRKILCPFGKWTHQNSIHVFRPNRTLLGQQGKNRIVPTAPWNYTKSWNFIGI